MRPNCPLCGKHLSLEESRDRKNTILFPNGVEVVICEQCGKRKKELEEKLAKASPSQIESLKTKANAELINIILRERELKEQVTLDEPTAPKKDEHGCIIGEEKWNEDLHQCVKIEKPTPTREQVTVPYQPAPEIPAQPVVPVGPVTIEQKVAALNDAIAKIQKDIAFIFGVLGQRPPE